MNVKQQGFSLIEAMVALFVLTVGLLGAASLQTQSLRSGSVAMQRIVVAMETQELMDRMLANPGVTRISATPSTTSSSLTIVETPISDLTTYNGATGVDGGCNTLNICTRDEMVLHDIHHWQSDLDNFLPGDPVYNIAVDPNMVVSLTVTWSEREIEQSYTLTSQIQPLVLVQQ